VTTNAHDGPWDTLDRGARGTGQLRWSVQNARVERIDDPDDPRLADYRHLNDAQARAAAGRDDADGDSGGDGHGCTIVEGAVALGVVLRSGIPLRSLLLTPNRLDALTPLLELVAPDVPVLVADREVLAGVVGFDLHRGVLASARRPRPTDPHALLRGRRRVVLAEGLNDHENLGSLYRNAAALGFEAVLLDHRSADPLYRRSVRVSSGWAAVLPTARIAALPDGYEPLRDRGFRVVALTPVASAVDVDKAAAAGLLDDPLALVVGAEGPGLSEAAIAQADVAVRVPMASGVDSLNVATSFAVVAAFAGARRSWT